jgi:hypothetical protein
MKERFNMIQFLPWIIGALIGAAVTLVIIDVLRWNVVVDWFQHRAYLKQADLNTVGFTLVQRQATGNYRTVQGVFNKQTNQVLDSHQVDSRHIDRDVAAVHAGKDLVFYE